MDARLKDWTDVSGRIGGHNGEYDWKCTHCGHIEWFASYTDPNKEGIQCSSWHDTIEDRPPGLSGKALPKKCVRFSDGTYMRKGSLMCRHGFEAGKDCEICYDEWKAKNDLYT